VRPARDTATRTLTARADEVDRIIGIEMGADDYLGKPFSPRELLARIKGVHSAIKSGMLAAESIAQALAEGRSQDVLQAYPEAFRQSPLHEELWKTRNFKAAMGKGLVLGSLLVGLDQVVFRGKLPFTLHVRKADHCYLKPASECQPIEYPKPDGRITFDRMSSVFISKSAARTSRSPESTVALRPVAASIGAMVCLARRIGETHSDPSPWSRPALSRRPGNPSACPSPTSSRGFPGKAVSSACMTLASVRPWRTRMSLTAASLPGS